MFDSPENLLFLIICFTVSLLFCLTILGVILYTNLVTSKQYRKSIEIMESWRIKTPWSENSYISHLSRIETNNKNPSIVFLCVNKEALVSYITMELIDETTFEIKMNNTTYTVNCSSSITKDSFHKKAHAFGSKELMKYGISVLASRCNVDSKIAETIRTVGDQDQLSAQARYLH